MDTLALLFGLCGNRINKRAVIYFLVNHPPERITSILLFSVQIYACDSNPCQNGATCSNDANDISKHKCQCPDWFTGINCEGNKTTNIEEIWQ